MESFTTISYTLVFVKYCVASYKRVHIVNGLIFAFLNLNY